MHEYLREVSLSLIDESPDNKKELFFMRLIQDKRLGLSSADILNIQKESLRAGCASSQVSHFLENEIAPVLKQYKALPTYVPSVEV